jgi:hypothetical protein
MPAHFIARLLLSVSLHDALPQLVIEKPCAVPRQACCQCVLYLLLGW